MLAKRIIPCLDVKDGVVVKGVKFRGHEVVGEIVPLAKRYAEEGADELVFYDITASSDGRVVDKSWISRVAEAIDIPFCVAGGIRTVEDAGRLLAYGADKISVNSPALADPDLISRLADRFGVQCVVVGIDSRHEEGSDEYRVNQFTGDEKKTRVTQWSTLDWVEEVQKRGAGEPVHFLEAFRDAKVDGALAASVFHKKIINIGDLKNYLRENNIEVRTC